MSVHIDFETRSELDVTKVGSYKYACHPSTEVLSMAYKIDDGPVKLWVPGWIRAHNYLPDEIQFHVALGGKIKAYNVGFEFNIWAEVCVRHYKWPYMAVTSFSCVAVESAMYNLPRALAKVANVLPIDAKKDKEGHAVMQRLSSPRAPSKNNKDKYFGDSERFDKLFKYCKKDVEVEYAVDQYLKDINEQERKYWLLDQKINRRGIPIDIETAKNAYFLDKLWQKKIKNKMIRLTNGAVPGPTALPKLKEWAKARGYVIESLAKEALPHLLKDPNVPPDVRKAIKLRHENNKSSTSKIIRMIECVNEDGRVRDTLLFYGAHTGRWTGKGVQITNLPQGKLEHDKVKAAIRCINARNMKGLKQFGSPPEVISSCLRAMICAPKGREFICADYASIEARMVLWLAGEKEAVKQMEAGVCLYRNLAAKIYDKDVADVTDDERQNGKRGILGCGYGMGAKRTKATAETYGADMTEEMSESIVFNYRSLYSKVPRIWKLLEEAAIDCVKYRKKTKVKGIEHDIYFGMRGRFLLCKLPSGRFLAYYEPVLSRGKFGQLQLNYMAEHSVTKKWVKHYMWGGIWLENIIQALARDIMVYGMALVEKSHKYQVLLNVYDEVLSECDKGSGDKQEYIDLLTSKAPWARTCPIEIKMKDCWIGRRFRKV